MSIAIQRDSDIVSFNAYNAVQIQRDDNQWYWAEYSTFSISDEVGKYRLTVSVYSGDAGDAMAAAQQVDWTANGMMFSTQDSDNDGWAGGNCAVNGLGWWFYKCSTSNLNANGNAIWTTGDPVTDVQTSRMLVKFH